MARSIPYAFCRYEISLFNNPLSREEQFEMLDDLVGRMVAHRKSNPSSADEDTFIMQVKTREILGYHTLSWNVARNLGERQIAQYDIDNDQVIESMIATDEIQYTRIISLPALGVLAIDARVSDSYLGATSAKSRLQSVIKNRNGARINIDFAGNPQDLQRALNNWQLNTFSFTVRPFNPSVTRLGEELHELMRRDHIAKLRGVGTRDENQPMQDSGEGLIAEVGGLVQSGYGQAAASGTTPSGFEANIGSPKFENDRQRNQQQSSKPRQLRVYIEPASTIEEEEEKVVEALLEFFQTSTSTK